MLWSVISHYPTRFTRSILREWCSHDGLLKKVDKSKDKRPSKLSRTVYHLTNKAKHFLANQHIWPNSAVNAPNVGLNSHNEQAIEVIVQGIYAAAFKYQTLGTTNQLYTTNNYQNYIVTNPNFIDKKIIVNQSLKAPDGAGAQQAAGGKRKGRTVADPQQRTPVEQASRAVPTSLTSTATNKQTINDQISIDKTVQDQLPQWLATYLPSNETLVDTLPQLSNQIGRLLVDGVLVPSVIRSTNNHKHGKEQDSLSSNSKVSDTSNNGNSDSGNNRNITSNDIDNANKSNLNALLKQYSIVGTPTNANQHTKTNTFGKKHARQGLAHVKDVSRKRHRRSLSGEATGKPVNTVVSGSTAGNCNGDDLSIFKAGDALCSQISLYEAYDQLNTSLSSYCHLQGMLNTGATVALWLLTSPVSDARDEINASQDSQEMVAIKPHRRHRKPNRKGRKHHQAVLRKVDKKGNQPHSEHSQQAVQSFFAEAQREQEINDRLEVYTDRQWRKSYEARSDNQATQSSQDDSNTKGFFSIEGTDEHIPEENGFTNLINKAKSDDYINYLANQAEQTTEPSEIMDHEREQSSNKLNKKQQNVLENHRGGKMPPKCPQNAPKMGALNQDHSANSEGAPKMPPKCPQNAPKMGALNQDHGANSEGAPKMGAKWGHIQKTASAPVEAHKNSQLPAVPSAEQALSYCFPNHEDSLNIKITSSPAVNDSSFLLTPHQIQNNYHFLSTKPFNFHKVTDWSHLMWSQIAIYLKLAELNFRHFSHHLDHLQFTDSSTHLREKTAVRRFAELNANVLTRDLSLINNPAFCLDDFDFSPFNRQFKNEFAEKNELPFVADMMISFNRHHQRHELFVELDNRTESNDRQANKILNYLQYAIKHPKKDIEVIFAVTDGSLSSNRVKKFSNVGRKLGNLANRIMQTFVIQNGKRVYLADLYQKASNLQVRLCGVSESYLDVAEYLLGSNYFPDYLVSLNKLVKVMNKEADWQATFIPNQMFKSLLKRPDLFTQVEGMNHAHYLNHGTKGLLRYLLTDQINRQNVWGKLIFSYPKADITYQQPVVFGHEHELSTIMETYNLSYLAKKRLGINYYFLASN